MTLSMLSNYVRNAFINQIAANRRPASEVREIDEDSDSDDIYKTYTDM